MDLYTVSCAKWREPILIHLAHTLIEDNPGQDALDRECISLDEVEDQISAAMWVQDRDNSDPIGDPRCPWEIGQEEIPIGHGERTDSLELAREGHLVSGFYADRLG